MLDTKQQFPIPTSHLISMGVLVNVNYVNVVDGTLLFQLQTDWLLLLELRAMWCGV